MSSKKPLADKALRDFENSIGMSCELDPSVNETLAGRGKPLVLSPHTCNPDRHKVTLRSF